MKRSYTTARAVILGTLLFILPLAPIGCAVTRGTGQTLERLATIGDRICDRLIDHVLP